MRFPLTGRLPPCLASELEFSRRMGGRVCEVLREGTDICQRPSRIFVRHQCNSPLLTLFSSPLVTPG